MQQTQGKKDRPFLVQNRHAQEKSSPNISLYVPVDSFIPEGILFSVASAVLATYLPLYSPQFIGIMCWTPKSVLQ